LVKARSRNSYPIVFGQEEINAFWKDLAGASRSYWQFYMVEDGWERDGGGRTYNDIIFSMEF